MIGPVIYNPTFDKEIKRISQNLINNNFPQLIVEKTINKTIEKLYKNATTELNDTTVVYYKCCNANTFNPDKRYLNDIAKQHIMSNGDKKFKICVYYKPKKLSSNFSSRTLKPALQQHGVVYKFNCNEAGCDASYIGHTLNTVETRAKQHKYAPSKIMQHFQTDHNKKPDNTILDFFTILYKSNYSQNVKLAEALLIKKERPYINVKYNEMSSGLHIF